MKAVVNYESGAKKVRLMEVEPPLPQAGQVRIRVSYCGICGTDIHIFSGDGGYPTNPPVTMGHELSLIHILSHVGDLAQHLVGEGSEHPPGPAFLLPEHRQQLFTVGGEDVYKRQPAHCATGQSPGNSHRRRQ